MSNTMPIYPEALAAVAALLDGLNSVEPDGAMLQDRIAILDPDDGLLIGWAVDEIGGVWSFQAPTFEEFETYHASH